MTSVTDVEATASPAVTRRDTPPPWRHALLALTAPQEEARPTAADAPGRNEMDPPPVRIGCNEPE
jgi:hypothetical protein